MAADRYRLVDPDRWVLSPQWTDESLAYERASADTHVLSPIARDIIEALRSAERASSAQELVQALAANVEDHDPVALHAAVEAMLLEFVRLGLAERTNP